MGKKQTFAKLTEDLEQIEKSEPEVKPEEPVAPIVEPEAVTPPAEEPKEEPKAEEPKEEPKEEEPVSKSEEPAEEPKAEEPKEEPKAEEPKEEEPVSKSTEEVEVVTEQDFLGAFEAVVKSYSGIKGDVSELKKSVEALTALVQSLVKPEVAEEPVSKSEEPKVEEPAEEPKAEEPKEEEPVSKSEEPAEEPEGKAVEFVSKSNGVPEIPAEDEAGTEEEPEQSFNPLNHVKQVTDYFMSKGASLSQGEKAAFRGAVSRVKRNEGTEADITLFKEVAEFYKNSEN